MSGKTILIGGGTGLVGSRLSELLKEKNYNVLHLSRKAKPDARFPAYKWDLKNKTIDPAAIEKADYVINLAGAGIVDGRWTNSRKKLIIDSRVDSTLILKNAFEKAGKTPKAFISASAIGFYGNTGEDWVKETDQPADNRLSQSNGLANSSHSNCDCFVNKRWCVGENHVTTQSKSWRLLR